MAWKMHDKEYANVVALPDFDRYTYMCAKFGDWREVWSLRNAGGWVLAGDDDGREGVPVWPHPRFAEACASGSWDGCTPAVIAVDLQDYGDGTGGTRYILVELPEEHRRRDPLFAFEREHAEARGFDGTPDEGQLYLFFDVKGIE